LVQREKIEKFGIFGEIFSRFRSGWPQIGKKNDLSRHGSKMFDVLQSGKVPHMVIKDIVCFVKERVKKNFWQKQGL